MFKRVSDRFSDLFSRFSNRFSYQFKSFSGAVSFCRHAALTKPPEFAQPRLSRVKVRSSPARGYKFGCVCSCMAGHEDAGVVTGHTGTNTAKFVPPR